MFLIKMFAYVITMLLFVIMLIFSIQMFIAFRLEIQTRHIERFSTEMAENIVSSPLTVDRAVFNVEELNNFHSNDHKAFMNPNGPAVIFKETMVGGEEPYTKHCKYGYKVKFEDLETKNTWEFGYTARDPDIWPEGEITSSVEYSVGIAYPRADKKGYDIHPAKMKLDIYHTWLTEITCLIENAWKFKEIQTIYLPCVVANKPSPQCSIPIWRSELNKDYICVFQKTQETTGDADCRYLPGIPLEKFDRKYSTSGLRMLKAVPIKEGAEVSCTDTPDNKLEDRVPKGNEKVRTIILCLSGPSEGGETGTTPKEEEKEQTGNWRVWAVGSHDQKTESIYYWCSEKKESGATSEISGLSLSRCREELRKRRQEYTAAGWTILYDEIDSENEETIKLKMYTAIS